MNLFGDRVTDFRSRLIPDKVGGGVTEATYRVNGVRACSRAPWALDPEAMLQWVKERRKGTELWAQGRA